MIINILYKSALSVLILPVAINAVFTVSRLSFYRQLVVEQLNVASLSCPISVTRCYCLLLYFRQINDGDDDDDNNNNNNNEADCCISQKMI